jgi:hypothetical protein
VKQAAGARADTTMADTVRRVGPQVGYAAPGRYPVTTRSHQLMSDEPITDAPESTNEQDAPAPERPPDDTDHRPSQAEGDNGDEDDE